MWEFETLRQGSLIVDEYDVFFVKLSDYASHMVSNEEEMIGRFVEGLRDYLFSQVGA